MQTQKKKYDRLFPPKFPDMIPLPGEWKNTVRGCHIPTKGPGLYTMDIEHISPDVVKKHNDPNSKESVISLYHGRVCIHRCSSCFNEELAVYSNTNRILGLKQTMQVIDSAIEIARTEGHDFQVVKFLGPGELLMNPELFDIICEYAKRGIFLNIFTKGAILGNDKLAIRFQGHAGVRSARDFVDKLASLANVGLIFSFQSFNPKVQDFLVTTRMRNRVLGLKNHTIKRDQALEYLLNSAFYDADGTTERFSLINGPIVPENIHESFDIYKFAIEHGTPIISTPTMVSGKGSCQIERQINETNIENWYNLVIELYSDIYVYNVLKGIQTPEQIIQEHIAAYAGLEPCNQVAHGLYLRANGIVQMCPGRFDSETVYGNIFDMPLEKIWMNSPNRKLGTDPEMRFNNHCPAKDSTSDQQNPERTFPFGFYDRVMERFKEKLKNPRPETRD